MRGAAALHPDDTGQAGRVWQSYRPPRKDRPCVRLRPYDHSWHGTLDIYPGRQASDTTGTLQRTQLELGEIMMCRCKHFGLL